MVGKGAHYGESGSHDRYRIIPQSPALRQSDRSYPIPELSREVPMPGSGTEVRQPHLRILNLAHAISHCPTASVA
ncbi:hypothetical protein CP532_5964 [Ophiocordyceps camponoti-leonardi (nom. inval.)]|nr:hypothetical protein CP532_5964 [Ophiocordyceps camponoti-leonardi (nom. inval.)]